MYKTTQLNNGLRVITHSMPKRQSVSIGLWVGVGGRHEDDVIKGAAHFLEHIVFKGTEKYSCEEIKELIEGVGGSLNAFTSEEQTCFYAKIPARHFSKTFDILSDMVVSPSIFQKDVKKESTVILEEIKMYHDLPQYCVIDMLDSLLWPNHPIGKGLIGTVDTVSSLNRRSLSKFHKEYYTPNNIVVAAAGELKHTEIVEVVKKKLGHMKPSEQQPFIPAENLQLKPRFKRIHKKIEQMHMAIGVLGYDENHKDRYAMTLLSVLLGGNMSSRLFVEVREKRGLAYSISCSSKTLHDTGVVYIRAGLDISKIVDATKVILKELNKVQKNLISESEFTRAKEYTLGQLLLGLEDTMDHMLWIGDSIISRNHVQSIEQIVKRFQQITREDIKRVAKDLLNPNRINLAITGPLTKKQESEIRKVLGIK